MKRSPEAARLPAAGAVEAAKAVQLIPRPAAFERDEPPRSPGSDRSRSEGEPVRRVSWSPGVDRKGAPRQKGGKHGGGPARYGQKGGAGQKGKKKGGR